MKVSCLCATYNRAPMYLHLLAEAVESFRRQVLPAGVTAELLVLNDTPGQTLHCHVAGVRIINEPSRYATLGEKRDRLCQLAEGEVFFPWDDDDISLPGRIAQALAFMGYTDGPQPSPAPPLLRGYFNPQRFWFLNSGVLVWNHHHGYGQVASAFTRRAWQAAGGYPPTDGNDDALIDAKLRQKVGVNPPLEKRQDWQYIYRWGVSPRHLSGHADGPSDNPHGPHYRRIGQQPIAPGAFTIHPAWMRDYQQLVKEALRSAAT